MRLGAPARPPSAWREAAGARGLLGCAAAARRALPLRWPRGRYWTSPRSPAYTQGWAELGVPAEAPALPPRALWGLHRSHLSAECGFCAVLFSLAARTLPCLTHLLQGGAIENTQEDSSEAREGAEPTLGSHRRKRQAGPHPC